MMQELTDAIRSLANGKAVRPDGVSVELFKMALNGGPALGRRLLDTTLVCMWRGGGGGEQWKDTITMVLRKTKGRTECGSYRGVSLVAHAGKILLKIIVRRFSQYLRAHGNPAGEAFCFPIEIFYRRYDVRDLSATGIGAEEPNSVVCIFYRLYNQSVRLR